ncbi:enoyl-ACP reductase FabV [Spirochaeta isovalerica]|uniref:Trans-2-enoyl-CoA reductase [NADH] n=1 Tax=Spirochaeta isovalerica TaxID=150 RepID=A0A841R3B4_9SPIO|nr:enoyl-ACP reductase FabV [Spirochaeta isovalerica]MBB6479544.1 enoyl-[acyl-carrier protein] reductase/trans-2-enoyl-CoA reductase (NAD+) [Spirochaeta isovalerica]
MASVHVKPMIINNVCLTTHPDGCAAMVKEQIEWTKNRKKVEGPKNALVIGCSTGYGLSSRIAASFSSGAGTIGISFEKEPTAKKPGSPGYYNNAEFDRQAKAAGIFSHTINGDAYSNEIREEVIGLIKENFGKVDLIIYSLASPVRTDPATGILHKSALKPLGESFTAKSVDFMKETVRDLTIEPAQEGDVENTVKVMGGEDWEIWINTLGEAGVLADDVKTVAYSYIGPEVTASIYRNGTIGKAKEHLEATALKLDEKLKAKGGRAFVSVNKALVTRASAYIPVVSLYISILFKVMKAKGIHEGCMEQIYRLFDERLYVEGETPVDSEGRIRIDDLEMRDDVQAEVSELWDKVSTETLAEVTDIIGYRKDFLQLHGFDVEGIDYGKDVVLED